MKNVFALFLLMSVAACTKSADQGGTGLPVSTDAYIVEDIPQSDVNRLYKTDEGGDVVEEGFMKDSLKFGPWVTYHPSSWFPEKLTSFVGGRANGPYFEFNERGQLKLQAHYKNNKLHGYWAKYRFGRPTTEAYYIDGKLHGVVREYDIASGDLQKEITYRNGVMDGPYRFYNDGKMTIEYIYKNGKKVSGGAINGKGSNEPR